MKVLVVDPNAARAAGVAEALAGSGATATIAPSASFALTMLEWNRQDVIISRAQVGDMDAREFCAMVRSDPSTAGVRFVLIASDVTPAQAVQHRIDLVIPEGLIGHAIVTRVTHLMRRDAASPPAVPPSVAPPPEPLAPAAAVPPSAPEPVVPAARVPPSAPEPTAPEPTLEPVVESAPEPIAEPVAEAPSLEDVPAVVTLPASAQPTGPEFEPLPTSAPAAAPSLADLDAVGVNGATRTFQGALGALALEDLAQAIATGRKTGRLLLVLGTGGGMIAFDGGRVVHAEVGDTTGETAFQSLVAAAHRERGGKFCFIPSASRDLANVPKTISRSVTDLLVGAVGAMVREG